MFKQRRGTLGAIVLQLGIINEYLAPSEPMMSCSKIVNRNSQQMVGKSFWNGIKALGLILFVKGDYWSKPNPHNQFKAKKVKILNSYE